MPFQLAVDELRQDEGALAEIRQTLPALERHCEPCGPKAVIGVLTPMVTLYGVQDRSEAEWRTFWGFYTRALGDLPLEALKRGVEDYVAAADSEFFPKPGPLKAMCERHAIPMRTALGRSRRAAA